MHYRYIFVRIVVIYLLVSNFSLAAEIERRRDQFNTDSGYYLYPIAGEVPGLGSTAGAGASVLNLGGSNADITGYYINGDFKAKGAALLDYHIIPKRLMFGLGYNDYLVAPISYERGIDSDPDNTILPKTEGRYLLGQLTLSYNERRYEAFARLLSGRSRLLQVLDRDEKAFDGIDTDWNNIDSISIGGSIDLTDDRLDPRQGNRFEFRTKLPNDNDPDQSEYFVTDFNLTHYLPFREHDTLAFNLFHSLANVTREGETDFATLQQSSGLNCDQHPVGTERDSCFATEEQHINSIIANNQYGTASSLGGTQRLRSFDNYRFYAGQALSYGMEYRWNLTDEQTPFDIYVAKGVRTGLQLSAFWERGMVAEHSSDLLDDARDSYGVGFRLILSGVVLRFDVAHGDEGVQTQLWLTYPWSMFSVDNPG
jgi:hypothetical protein